MHAMSDTISEAAPKRFQCRHIHADGRRCGSPALRSEELCYFHHTSRKPAGQPRARRSRQATFDLPLPDPTDRTGLQLAIADVLRRIASNQVDPRRAGLLLYGLQIASLNLPRQASIALPAQRPEPASQIVDEIVLDPNLGALAPRSELGHDTPGARRKSFTERLLAELERGRAELEEAEGPHAPSQPGVPAPAHAFSPDPSIPGPHITGDDDTTGQQAPAIPATILPSLKASATAPLSPRLRPARHIHRHAPGRRAAQAAHPPRTLAKPSLVRSLSPPQKPPRPPSTALAAKPVSPCSHAPPSPHPARRPSLVAPPP